MIPNECKRLAEVDFPIAVVSKHSAREKSIRHGHPSTLHLWWARRPLAACRAMLMALLLPDPCDEKCPKEFKEKVRKTLREMRGRPHGWDALLKTDDGLRKVLLRFIGDFSNWDHSSDQEYLDVGRELVKAAHPDETPLVVDPFAGGGSIPLEALRLGCDAFASDLNPVACLIQKVMLEDIPRHGPELAEELRRVGAEIKKQAEKELAEFYPKDPDGGTPIAYLWARTVRCESPNCGAEIPLVRSFWLCKKDSRKRALRYMVERPKGKQPQIEFEIFEPKSDNDVPSGTVTRANATCPCCRMVLPATQVRAQLAAQRGGANVVFDGTGKRTGGARLLVVVMLNKTISGRQYRLPTGRDYAAVYAVQQTVAQLPKGAVPDEPLPPIGTLGFRVQRYGVLQWGDLFTFRQRLALLRIAECIRLHPKFSQPIALSLGKLADLANAICPWEPIAECARNVLSNGRVKPSWDFAEAVPISDASGSLHVCVDNLMAGVTSVGSLPRVAQCQLAAAQTSQLPDSYAAVWFTDPPYYDAIPYSDLSDFFFVWLKRALPKHPILRDPFDSDNPLTPKRLEAVQDETKQAGGHPKDKTFFENTMAAVFTEGHRVLAEDGIGCVVFAHKTTEGWEALLTGIIRGGYVITGSWPIATEQQHRLRARDSAALATSVHLVCRPRPDNAPVGDWADVLRELPKRVGDWMERLQTEGIRGADLVFACIGPALEIFSRYSKVEDAEGRPIPLGGDPEAKEPDKRGYLAYVWETVGRIALQNILGTAEAKARNGAAGVLEEDARLTALFLWTLQGTSGESSADGESDEDDADGDDDEEAAPKGKAKGFSLVFDVVRRFAQPLGIELPQWEGRVIETKKGVVRLMAVSERAKQLFGEDGAGSVADWLERDPEKNLQQALFPELEEKQTPKIRGRGRRIAVDGKDVELQKDREATTLDRVHAAMLLQAGGKANALRALIKAEQDRGSDFLRLANALSALYPMGSEEKRLLDAMLLAVPR